MSEELDPRYCNAKKRDGSGERCKQPAGHGVPGVKTGKCSKHGGCTPTHKRHAEAEMARAAVERYGLSVNIDPGVALLKEVARSYGAVLHLEAKVAELAELYGETFHVSGIATGEAKPHVLWVMLMAERKRHADVCADTLRANVDQRAIRLAEQFAPSIAAGFEAFARMLGHDPQSAEVREAGRKALTVIAGGAA
jgi:hypothetical protein